MAMTIEKILKSGMNNQDRHNWNYQEVIANNKSKVFIYDYPIDDIFKDDFEKHFCAHFYLRDLAFQNVGEFCYYLSERLNNIFPYYNEFFKRIGNYDELFTNLGYDETITRTHDETKNKSHDEKGTYKSDTTSQTTGKDTQNITDDNVTKGRDFPNSAIDLDSTSYYTDSSETKNTQDTQRNTETDMTGNQDDTSTNKYDDSETNKYNETETRHYTNNDNLNVYDFLMKYRRDIDNIYGEIYMRMDDLFIGIL